MPYGMRLEVSLSMEYSSKISLVSKSCSLIRLVLNFSIFFYHYMPTCHDHEVDRTIKSRDLGLTLGELKLKPIFST